MTNQIQIKLVPQTTSDKLDVWLEKELISQNVSSALAVHTCNAVVRVLIAQGYSVTRQDEFPMGGRYWLLVKSS